MLIVPADPLAPRRPDPHFADEYRCAREAGYPAGLVDHDAVQSGHAHRALGKLEAGTALYRGWMLPADRYAELEQAARHRGVHLRTTATHYRRAHELPGWYAALRSHTPESAWTRDSGRNSFESALTQIHSTRAVIRDYSKSLSHEWLEAMYIPDTSDTERAWQVASRFAELRGNDFDGGFVVRAFEEFTGAEVRTWWADGAPVAVTPHPNTPDSAGHDIPDLDGVAEAVAQLDLPFVTVDFTRRADGLWRVVELGDGQVSDRPRTIAAEDFIAAIACLL